MAISELLKFDIATASTALRAGDFTAVELTEAYLEAVEASRGLNIFITETPERAIADAAKADQCIRSGASSKMTGIDRKSTRLNSSHSQQSRMPSSA